MAKPRNNIYDPNYISKRENISYEEALLFIENFKKNKATNKQNFIKKYGEEEGIKLYKEWISKSLAKGHRLDGKYKSLYSKEYYIKHGYSEEDAIRFAIEAQHRNSPLHVEYYLNRGYTEEEAKKKIRKIHSKKLGKNYLLEVLKKNNPDKTIEEILELQRKIKDSSSVSKIGLEKHKEKIRKTRKTFEEKNLWIPLDKKTDYDAYKHLVWYYTNMNDLKTLENCDKRGKTGVDGAYHLDHIFSISSGYINGIPPEIIGSIKNLKFIPWKENVSKQAACHITKEELLNEN